MKQDSDILAEISESPKEDDVCFDLRVSSDIKVVPVVFPVV